MTQSESRREMLTIEDTAQTLGVSVRTVYRLARAGKLGSPSYLRAGRPVNGTLLARRVYFERVVVEQVKRERFARRYGPCDLRH